MILPVDTSSRPQLIFFPSDENRSYVFNKEINAFYVNRDFTNGKQGYKKFPVFTNDTAKTVQDGIRSLGPPEGIEGPGRYEMM